MIFVWILLTLELLQCHFIHSVKVAGIVAVVDIYSVFFLFRFSGLCFERMGLCAIAAFCLSIVWMWNRTHAHEKFCNHYRYCRVCSYDSSWMYRSFPHFMPFFLFFLFIFLPFVSFHFSSFCRCHCHRAVLLLLLLLLLLVSYIWFW